jgi:hypothetical protein
VIVIYCQVCNFTLISCEKFIFDEIDDDDDICFELIQHVEFDFYSASSLKPPKRKNTTGLYSKLAVLLEYLRNSSTSIKLFSKI